MWSRRATPWSPPDSERRGVPLEGLGQGGGCHASGDIVGQCHSAPHQVVQENGVAILAGEPMVGGVRRRTRLLNVIGEHRENVEEQRDGPRCSIGPARCRREGGVGAPTIDVDIGFWGAVEDSG